MAKFDPLGVCGAVDGELLMIEIMSCKSLRRHNMTTNSREPYKSVLKIRCMQQWERKVQSEPPSVDDDVDVWRYTILELRARNDDDRHILDENRNVFRAVLKLSAINAASWHSVVCRTCCCMLVSWHSVVCRTCCCWCMTLVRPACYYQLYRLSVTSLSILLHASNSTRTRASTLPDKVVTSQLAFAGQCCHYFG